MDNITLNDPADDDEETIEQIMDRYEGKAQMDADRFLDEAS